MPASACVVVCRRPTFSETKHVLHALVSISEPSSHALQAAAPLLAAMPCLPARLNAAHVSASLSLCMIRRRPTFSETKRVLHALVSVFEPSSHALQAAAPAKQAAPKPPKASPKKEDPASSVAPTPQAPKVSLLFDEFHSQFARSLNTIHCKLPHRQSRRLQSH